MVINPKIAAISYLNTIPFIYGIRHEGNLVADLVIVPPSDCAKQFAEGKVDMALVPAAVVPTLKGAEIVTDYCIGAVGAVRTVVIVSNTPIEQVRRIWLDSHSRTSVQLAGYLAQYRWKITPEWLAMDDYSVLDHPQEGDAFLLIGDKVFGYEGRFAYSYDLAQEWIAHTRLPFVFAVWVARKGTSYELYDSLQRALTFGVEHTYEAILDSDEHREKPYAYEYLTRNIDFLFDEQKHKALKKFWDFGMKVQPKVNPG
ncbi:MAG: menaquinone biosynthesis protein [Alistipes sp.]|nr:menaquinone biosynthesis protein [Alistipes sp.]